MDTQLIMIFDMLATLVVTELFSEEIIVTGEEGEV